MNTTQKKTIGKKIKRTFTNNAELCHVWASRSQDAGRCGNIFFEGDSIYSYGKHYEIARFVKMPGGGRGRGTLILLNITSDSNSTARHKNHVISALHGRDDYKILHMPGVFFDDYKGGVDWFKISIQDKFQHAAKARIYRFEACKNACMRINALKLWAKYNKRKASYTLSPDQIKIIRTGIAQARANKAAAEVLTAKRREEAEQRHKELIEACGGDIAAYWHKHGRLPGDYNADFYYSYRVQTLCRVDGTDIVTSRGARVPVEHARRLYPLILRARRKKQPIRYPLKKRSV